MFRQLNKSAIWYSCVNALTTDYEISQNYPGAVLQSTSLSNNRIPWAYPSRVIEPTRSPARPPAMVGPGYVGVGRSIGGIKFPTLFWCADSFLGVTRILSIRRPPHPLTYTNIDIETGILVPVSTDTNRQKSYIVTALVIGQQDLLSRTK